MLVDSRASASVENHVLTKIGPGLLMYFHEGISMSKLVEIRVYSMLA